VLEPKWWVSEPSEARCWSLEPSNTIILLSNMAPIANVAGFEWWVPEANAGYQRQMVGFGTE